MFNTDKCLLKLIELLIFEKKVKSISDFAKSIGILEQTISKIKKGNSHFTVSQIQTICKVYNVNANWIFGMEKAVYNHKNSIEIDEFILHKHR